MTVEVRRVSDLLITEYTKRAIEELKASAAELRTFRGFFGAERLAALADRFEGQATELSDCLASMAVEDQFAVVRMPVA